MTSFVGTFPTKFHTWFSTNHIQTLHLVETTGTSLRARVSDVAWCQCYHTSYTQCYHTMADSSLPWFRPKSEFEPVRYFGWTLFRLIFYKWLTSAVSSYRTLLPTRSLSMFCWALPRRLFLFILAKSSPKQSPVLNAEINSSNSPENWMVEGLYEGVNMSDLQIWFTVVQTGEPPS